MISKILIVEDHDEQARWLQQLVTDRPQTEVVGVATSLTDARELIAHHQPDIVLLDIELPDGTGLELLQSPAAPTFKTIVITAYPEFAIPSIRLPVEDYLLKPLIKEELWIAIDRIVRLIQEDVAEYGILKAYLKQSPVIDRLVIPSDTDKRSLVFDEIVYIKSDGGYTIFYTKDRGHVFTSRSIRYFEQILPHNFFFRTHKSYIVNFSHITMIPAGRGGDIQLCNTYWAQLSVRRAAAFRRWYRERTL